MLLSHTLSQNKPLLQRVLLLMVPGMDRATWQAKHALLPNMTSLLGNPVTVLAKNATCFTGRVQARYRSLQQSRRCTGHAILQTEMMHGRARCSHLSTSGPHAGWRLSLLMLHCTPDEF